MDYGEPSGQFMADWKDVPESGDGSMSRSRSPADASHATDRSTRSDATLQGSKREYDDPMADAEDNPDSSRASEPSDSGVRSSARSVKRKKFADETVDSSLRPAYYRNRSGSDRVKPKGATDLSLPKTATPPSRGFASKGKKRKARSLRLSSSTKKANKPRQSNAGPPTMSNMNFGGGMEGSDPGLDDNSDVWYPELQDANDGPTSSKSRSKKKKGVPDEAAAKRTWMAMDDMKLITAMQQLHDFPLVANYATFSTKTDAVTLQRRWNELLNDPEKCRESMDVIDRVPLENIQRIRKMKFFTEVEEDVVKSVVPADANVENFEKVLRQYNHLFFPGRQSDDLLANWKYASQRVKTELGKEPPATNPELPASFSELKDKYQIDAMLTKASCFGKALHALTSHLNFRSKHIGCEVAYLKALSERLATASLPDQQRPKFQRDHKTTLAFLCGVCVDYAIIKEEATFGYSDENVTVDIDLSLEGNIVNLQPMQGVIYLDVDGAFHIENRGSSTVSIDGQLVEEGSDMELHDNAAVDIGTLAFQFYRNNAAVKKHVEKVVADYAARGHSGASLDQEGEGSSPERSNHFEGNSEDRSRRSPSSSGSSDDSRPRFRIDEDRVMNGHATHNQSDYE